jgi:hypothetical protein
LGRRFWHDVRPNKNVDKGLFFLIIQLYDRFLEK